MKNQIQLVFIIPLRNQHFPKVLRQCWRYKREYLYFFHYDCNLLKYNREFRQRYAWQPERPPNTLKTQEDPIVRTPSPPPASAPSAPASSAMPNEVTHVRTFRVFEAVKLDDYVLTYDSY